MLAFVCNFYGGMPHEWLATPVRTFFAMYREGLKMEARQYSELADISLIANNMDIKYYMSVKHRYNKIIWPEVGQLPPEAPNPAIDAGSEDATIIMRSVAMGLRQRLGYG